MQHKKRGRPRLREEDNLREIAFGGEYSHSEVYSNQSSVLSDPQSDHRRSKTYRELRSQPEIPYIDQRPRTSDSAYSDHQYLRGAAAHTLSPPTHSLLSDNIPTVLLTPDFIVAQHNRAFSDALSLSFTARGQTLLDLVVSSEREKIQRLQAVMRAELRDAAHPAFIRGGPSSLGSMPAIEHLDIAQATAGFRTRSEYWTFRLPREQSRGFPISISLARDGGPFVVLTLVQSTSALQALQSSPASHLMRSPPVLPSSSIGGINSPPPHSHHTNHSHQHRHHRNSPSDVALPYLLSSTSSPMEDHMLPLQPSHSLAQYKQYSPPRPVALPYNAARTDSGSSGGSSDIPRSSPGHHHQALSRDNLRHLQLPPIRTAPTSDPSAQQKDPRRRNQAETPSPSRSSPQSGHSGKRKKRRRVDIEEMLR